MKKLLTRLTLGIFAFVLLIPGVNAVNSDIQVDATDTVAGYGTLVRVSDGPANSNLELLLEKPDGGKIIFEAETSSKGSTKVDIAGFYTKKAGDYELSVSTIEGASATSNLETFQVYADNVSTSRSLMEVNKQTASANGNDYVNLKVHLYDRYNNPIHGHTVDLLSSRLTDEIVRISSNPYTNELGTIQFNAYSREAGVSTFIAHDSTEGVALNDRAEIAFYAPSNQISEMGGNKHGVTLASGEDSGPVSYLAIEDLSSSVTLNSSQNFTITAYDDDGVIASDYTGTVRFSSSDNNSTLPDDYTFEAEDQGSHTFSLSLSFKTEGTQTLTATDIDNTDVFGEFDVEVDTSGSGASTTGDNTEYVSDEDFTISTPIAGTYSADSLTFTGEATYGLSVQVYDNDLILGETTVTAENAYSYQVSSLEDGEHIFVLKTETSAGEIQDTSDEIKIQIDTTAPVLDYAEMYPEGEIEAGSTFTITVYTEPDLPQVGVIFNSALYELTEDLVSSGMYEGSFTTPEALGEYTIDVLLVDEIGNEISHTAELSVTVIESTTEEIPETTEDAELYEAAEEEIIYYPGQVTGIEALAGDGRVTLSWEAPETVITEAEYEEWLIAQEEENNKDEDETTEDVEEIDEELAEEDDELEEGELEEEIPEIEFTIDHYRIYYGPTPEMMTQKVDTWDSGTTWYVPSLYNGSTYYFSVVAITDEDLESLQKSESTSGSPEAEEIVAIEEAAEEMAKEEEIEAAEEAAVETALEEEEIPTETGPEVAWLLLFSIGFTQGYATLRKRRNKIIVPIQDIHV
ncbi:hypothetical protein HN748_01945 [Candidatus Peregrinibacteria bacterium]|jgi:hypothetical protein|nr:hypothetical protein [Candidatus Peregrinibacteria bacterium]MBT7483626.1 hypothetical protein [Candidatus Peregrinibacteria bacterium]MBT7702971.1 hypothetical protein [Candidatus Peregrinibacteria bacterium]